MAGEVEGILLAAGLSTRFGQSKLIVKLGGKRVIDMVLCAAIESELAKLRLVVSRASFPENHILEEIARHGVKIIFNPAPHKGMSSSLKLGLEQVSPHANGAMILLGDQPLISSRAINALIRAFRNDPSRIVRPAPGKRGANPVIFPKDLFPDLMKIQGDIGGREVIENNRTRLVEIDMTGERHDLDLDTADDMRLLERIVSRRNNMSHTREPERET